MPADEQCLREPLLVLPHSKVIINPYGTQAPRNRKSASSYKSGLLDDAFLDDASSDSGSEDDIDSNDLFVSETKPKKKKNTKAASKSLKKRSTVRFSKKGNLEDRNPFFATSHASTQSRRSGYTPDFDEYGELASSIASSKNMQASLHDTATSDHPQKKQRRGIKRAWEKTQAGSLDEDAPGLEKFEEKARLKNTIRAKEFRRKNTLPRGCPGKMVLAAVDSSVKGVGAAVTHAEHTFEDAYSYLKKGIKAGMHMH